MSFSDMHEVLRSGGGTFTPAIFAGQKVEQWVWRALDDCGKWHKRHCSLQAPLVVSSVLAMNLLGSLSIVNVFKRILDAVRGVRDVALSDITPEALYKARARLGVEPMRPTYRPGNR